MAESASCAAICLHCGKHGADLKRCLRCKLAQFCGLECQRKGWKQHKRTCAPPATEPEAPWDAARKQGNTHFRACEWTRAIASYTRGLRCDSIPPGGAAALYSNRAAALLKQLSYVKAGQDARAGLASISGGELLTADLKQELIDTARAADLGAPAPAPWLAAQKEGDANIHASEWASAIASFTRGLELEPTRRPERSLPGSFGEEGLVIIYKCSAQADLAQGSWHTARVLARAGLAIFTFSELHQTVLDLKPQIELLISEALTAEMRAGWEEMASSPREVIMADPTSISTEASRYLRDLETTAYFQEAQFRDLHRGSQQRFLATAHVSACIVVFASSPARRAFGAHINTASLFSSLYATKVRGQGGVLGTSPT